MTDRKLDESNTPEAATKQEATRPPPREIPAEVIAEAQRQVDNGAAFFDKPLSECSREELYAAVILGWYDAQNARRQLAELAAQKVSAT